MHALPEQSVFITSSIESRQKSAYKSIWFYLCASSIPGLKKIEKKSPLEEKS